MKDFNSFRKIMNIISEATEARDRKANLRESTPGKPETMAQKHTRMAGYGMGQPAHKSQKQMLSYVREVAADWKSGDMPLSRAQALITAELGWLRIGSGIPGGGTESQEMDALAAAFRKKVKAAGLEPTSRLGKGSGFNPSMGKITPNQIQAYFDLIVDFVQNDWPKIAKSTVE
jgi:hypothetical protein